MLNLTKVINDVLSEIDLHQLNDADLQSLRTELFPAASVYRKTTTELKSRGYRYDPNQHNYVQDGNSMQDGDKLSVAAKIAWIESRLEMLRKSLNSKKQKTVL